MKGGYRGSKDDGYADDLTHSSAFTDFLPSSPPVLPVSSGRSADPISHPIAPVLRFARPHRFSRLTEGVIATPLASNRPRGLG